MNGWGQFFLATLVIVLLAASHRRYMRYRIVRKMIEAGYKADGIVEVLETYSGDGMVDKYINSEMRE